MQGATKTSRIFSPGLILRLFPVFFSLAVTMACQKGMVNFLSETDPNKTQVRIIDEKMPYLSNLAGATGSGILEWEATASGSFAVYLNGDCNTGTPVASNTGRGLIGAGGKAQILISASELSIGINQVTVCLAVEKSQIVKTTTAKFLRDDTPPVSTAFPGGGVFLTLPQVSLSCSDNCARSVYTLDGSEPNIDGSGTSILYTGPITLPASGATLKVKSVDYAGNAETSSVTQVYQKDFVPNLTINSITHTKLSTNGHTSSIIDFSTDQPGLPYKLLLDAADCTPAAGVLPSGTTTSGSNTAAFTALNLGSAGTHTIRICSTSLLGNDGSVSVTVDRKDTPPAVSISPAAGNYPTTIPDITMSCNPGIGAIIAYTINGATPNIALNGTVTVGTLYTGPFLLADRLSSVLRVRCRDAYGNQGGSFVATFNVDTDNAVTLTLASQQTMVSGSDTLNFQYTSTRNLTGAIQDISAFPCAAALSSVVSPGGTKSVSPASSLITADGSTISVRLNVKKISGDCVSSNAITVTRDDSAPVITANLTSGPYTGPQSVTLNCSDNCVRLAYTTDGSTPLLASDGTVQQGSEYTAPIAIPSSSIVKIRTAAVDTLQRISTADFQYSTDAPAPVISLVSLDRSIISTANPTATWVWNAGGAGQFYEVHWFNGVPSGTCPSANLLRSGMTDGNDIAITLTAVDLYLSGQSIVLCVKNADTEVFESRWFNNLP